MVVGWRLCAGHGREAFSFLLRSEADVNALFSSPRRPRRCGGPNLRIAELAMSTTALARPNDRFDPATPGSRDARAGVGVAEHRRRGRGAGLNPVGRFEPHARETVDDGWESLAELPPLRTEVREERARSLITRNTSPDIGFDRSANPLPRLRARLHLLLRPPRPRLRRPVAGDRLRDAAVRQVERGGGTRTRPRRPWLPAEDDRDRHGDGPLPADRARAEADTRRARGARAHRPSGGDRHQVGAGGARSRHPVAHGGARPRQGGDVGHDARPPPRPLDGAARRDAGQAPRGDHRALAGRRAGGGADGAGDPGPERRRG